MPSLPWNLATFLHAAAIALGLLTYVLVTRIGRQRRHPSAAIGWVLGIVAFPYAAVPLYLMIGSRKLARPRRAAVTPPAAAAPSDAPGWIVRLTAGLGLAPVRSGARITILTDGEVALQALLGLIDGAGNRLDLCTYVFADDATGRRVAGALIAAARRGVRVRLLIDAIGSVRTPRALRVSLSAAGVLVGWFMPLLHNPLRGRTNLRNHRKLAIADAGVVWSGGRNIADEYFGGRAGEPAWLDLSFVIEGGIAIDAQTVFDTDWQRGVRRAALSPPVSPSSSPSSSPSPPVPHPADHEAPAQLIASGPERTDDTLYELLLSAVYQAEVRLIVMTPYFVPDDALVQALAIACRRGVALTVLVPRRSNHRLADLARERALRDLAAAGAGIRLVEGMSHAKLVIVDDQVALCGSANIDGRSLFLNHELTTAFYGSTEITDLANWVLRQSERAAPYVARHPSLPRDILEGTARTIGFQL